MATRALELTAQGVVCDLAGVHGHGLINVQRNHPGRSHIELGTGVWLHACELFTWRDHAHITIGDYAFVNVGSSIYAAESVTIGAGTGISWGVQILDYDFHTIDGRNPVAPVTIGEGVAVFSRATILKGVTIGDGAVIGTGAVVRTDIPPRTLALGNPARVIKRDVVWSKDIISPEEEMPPLDRRVSDTAAAGTGQATGYGPI